MVTFREHAQAKVRRVPILLDPTMQRMACEEFFLQVHEPGDCFD